MSRDNLAAVQIDDELPGSGADILVESLRQLGENASLDAVRRMTVSTATASINGACGAALITMTETGCATTAATSGLALTLNTLQSELGGPSVDVLHSDRLSLNCSDLRIEARWPAFAAAAVARTPIRSMTSYKLYLQPEEPLGSLTVYAAQPHAFAPDTARAGERLAAYSAVVLAYTHERVIALNLRRALDSNRDIGAALGILMARYLITRSQAFDLLKIASQRANRKLREVAAEVIDTGDLIGADTWLITRVATAPPTSKRVDEGGRR